MWRHAGWEACADSLRGLTGAHPQIVQANVAAPGNFAGSQLTAGTSSWPPETQAELLKDRRQTPPAIRQRLCAACAHEMCGFPERQSQGPRSPDRVGDAFECSGGADSSRPKAWTVEPVSFPPPVPLEADLEVDQNSPEKNKTPG